METDCRNGDFDQDIQRERLETNRRDSSRICLCPNIVPLAQVSHLTPNRLS
jgi:hypothetical protein